MHNFVTPNLKKPIQNARGGVLTVKTVVTLLFTLVLLTACGGGGGGGGGASGPANTATLKDSGANTPNAAPKAPSNTPYPSAPVKQSDITFETHDYLNELRDFLEQKQAEPDHESKVYVVKMPAESSDVLADLKNVLKNYPTVKVYLDLNDLTTEVLPNECFYISGEELPSITGVILPKNTKKIGDKSLYNLQNLTEVYIPNTVESIEYLGLGKTGLTTVNVPPSVKKIEEAAFYNCINLEKVTLHDGLKEIIRNAFQDCKKLTSIDLPKSVERIEQSVFLRCSNLKTVTLHNGLKEIGTAAFKGCVSLGSIDIPPSVKKIEDAAFYNCINLEKVTLHDGLEEIGEFAFCVWGTEKDTGTDDRSVNDKLTRIDIPASVKKIGYQAFRKCTALKYVTLHEGLQIISGLAFNLTGIESITVPSTVIHLGDDPDNDRVDPFCNTEHLREVKLAPRNKNYKIGTDGCLYTIDGKEIITYPNMLPNTTFTVGPDIQVRSRVFYAKTNLKEVIIEDGTMPVTIGEENCTSSSIEKITIPKNAVSIGEDLCKWASRFKSVVMKDTDSRWNKIQVDKNGIPTGSVEVITFTDDESANFNYFKDALYRFEKISD